MKQTVTEIENEGLEGLLGQVVTLFSLNYIYAGKLVGVNDKFVKLESASIVYETGSFCDKAWSDAQALPHPVYVMLRCVESFMVLK
jgi:hypothetical protein